MVGLLHASLDADQRFEALATRLNARFDGEIRIGGNYASVVADGRTLHVSGQVPRVGTEVVVQGRVGGDVNLDAGQHAARICAMRVLAVLRQHLGSLSKVARIAKINVFVQCTEHFTQHSEVADAASGVFHEVLGERGVHARTSVGVYQLPKNAAVELDAVAIAVESV